jgi:hypothetical protein
LLHGRTYGERKRESDVPEYVRTYVLRTSFECCVAGSVARDGGAGLYSEVHSSAVTYKLVYTLDVKNAASGSCDTAP